MVVRNLICSIFPCNINCDEHERRACRITDRFIFVLELKGNNATESYWWFNNGSIEGPHCDKKGLGALLFISNISMNSWWKFRLRTQRIL